jgi:hypothetical protein
MTPTIPRGWRRLRLNEIIKQGDRVKVFGIDDWQETKAMGEAYCGLSLYIRRIAKKGKRK